MTPWSPRVGVCSWSLLPESPEDLACKAQRAGFDRVQLSLGPIAQGAWDIKRARDALAAAEVEILSGMLAFAGEDYSTLESIKATGGVRPTGAWPANRDHAARVFDVGASLGLRLVTFHAGFFPHDPHDPERRVVLNRCAEVCALALDRGIRPAFETGQESVATLLPALDELDPRIGVNFDPANMLLYGQGDPIDALDRLAHRVAQIHIKDARVSRTRGQWGEETPAGQGEVDWTRFATVYRARGLRCDLIVEREGGDRRAQDAGAALRLVRSLAWA